MSSTPSLTVPTATPGAVIVPGAAVTIRPLSASFTVTDLTELQRRNTAYAALWRTQVEDHSQAQKRAVVQASRQRLVASAVPRHRRRAEAARQLLSSPLPANITPQQYESHAAARREAMQFMHEDCMAREEIALRNREASREATLAADRAQTLGFLKQEAALRVRSNRQQLEEALLHKRALSHRRLQTDRAAELAERAKEKEDKQERRQRHADSLAQSVESRRRQKEAAIKKGEEEARGEAKAREAAAEMKRRTKRAQAVALEREKDAEYAKRLEKAWKYSDGLCRRARDAFRSHVMLHGLQEHDLVKQEHELAHPTAKLDQFGNALPPGSSETFSLETEASATTLPELSAAYSKPSIFYSDWADAEIRRLHKRLELTRERASTAKAAFQAVARDLGLPAS